MTNLEWIEYYRFHPSEFEALITFCEGQVIKKENLEEHIKALLFAIEPNRGDLSQNQRQALDNLRAALEEK
jgi:hypothetical protein